MPPILPRPPRSTTNDITTCTLKKTKARDERTRGTLVPGRDPQTTQTSRPHNTEIRHPRDPHDPPSLLYTTTTSIDAHPRRQPVDRTNTPPQETARKIPWAGGRRTLVTLSPPSRRISSTRLGPRLPTRGLAYLSSRRSSNGPRFARAFEALLSQPPTCPASGAR